jgi:hypothetical protein
VGQGAVDVYIEEGSGMIDSLSSAVIWVYEGKDA